MLAKPLATALREAWRDTPFLYSKPRAVFVAGTVGIMKGIAGGVIGWDVALYTLIAGVGWFVLSLLGRILMIPNKLGRRIEKLEGGLQKIEQAGELKMAAREMDELKDLLAARGEFNLITSAIPDLTVKNFFKSTMLDRIRQDQEGIAYCKLFRLQELYESHKHHVTGVVSGIQGFTPLCNQHIDSLNRCEDLKELLECFDRHAEALRTQAAILIDAVRDVKSRSIVG